MDRRNLSNFKIIEDDFVAVYSGKTESFRPLKDRWEFIDRWNSMIVPLVVRLNKETQEYELIEHKSGRYPHEERPHS